MDEKSNQYLYLSLYLYQYMFPKNKNKLRMYLIKQTKIHIFQKYTTYLTDKLFQKLLFYIWQSKKYFSIDYNQYKHIDLTKNTSCMYMMKTGKI